MPSKHPEPVWSNGDFTGDAYPKFSAWLTPTDAPNIVFKIAISLALARVIRALRAKKSKKVPGPLGPGSKKAENQVKTEVKTEQKTTLTSQPCFNIFQPFSTPGPGVGESLFDVFGILGPKGPTASCKGPGRLQSKALSKRVRLLKIIPPSSPPLIISSLSKMTS